MQSGYTPTLSDIEGAWIRDQLIVRPNMKADPDNSEAGDEFWRFRAGIERDTAREVANTEARIVALIEEQIAAKEQASGLAYNAGWKETGDAVADDALMLAELALAIESGEHR